MASQDQQLKQEKRPWFFQYLGLVILWIIVFAIIVCSPWIVKSVFLTAGAGEELAFSPGEMLAYIGAVLTLLGTAGLGTLVYVQNRQMRNESEIHAERLRSIANHANEIALINKIIEMENKRIFELENTLDEFSALAKPQNIYLAAKTILPDVTKYEGSVPQSVIDKYWKDFSLLVERKNAVEMSFNRLKRFFQTNDILTEQGENFFAAIGDVYDSAKEHIDHYTDPDIVPAFELFLGCKYKDNNDIYEKFYAQREDYISQRKSNLDRVIFEELTLDEIKELLHSHKTLCNSKPK